MAQPKPPSTVERALATLKAAPGPMAFRELLEAILSTGPIAGRDPAQTLRSAIFNTKLIVAVGDGRYEYLPRATTGCVLRHRLDFREADEGVIVWGRDVAVAIWPAAWETEVRRDRAPRTFHLGNGQQVALGYEFLGPHRFGSVEAAPVWAWLRGEGARSGDSLLVTIRDGEVELTLEPQKQRDEDEIRRRNVEVCDLLEAVLAKRADKRALFHEAVAALIVRGAFRSPCPPDPLVEIAGKKKRFGMDSITIGLASHWRDNPWMRMLE